METVFVLLVALAGLGAAVGVGIAVRVGRDTARSGAPGQQIGLERLRGTLHLGAEQTLLGLHREVDLPRGVADVPYGGMYVVDAGDRRLVIRTRSEIDRGLMS